MKKYLAASIFIIATVSTSAIVITKGKSDLKACHSDVIWIKDNDTVDGLVLKSKMSILLTEDNHGRMNIYGQVKDHTMTYRIDRAIHFDYKSIDKKGNYAINFTTLSITTSDNTPDELFSHFIQLEKDKIKYYVNISKMEDNIFILKDEAYSSFTCHAEN